MQTNFGWPEKAVGEIVYDMRCTLYTNKPIRLQQVRIQRVMLRTHPFIRFQTQIEIPFSQIQEDYQLQLQTFIPKTSGVVVKVIANLKAPMIDLTDISQYVDGTSLYQEDRTLRTFLELVTSQNALNRSSSTH